MNILLVGAGALGKLVAAQLAQAGAKVHLLVRREEQKEALLRNGIGVFREGAKVHVKMEACTDLQEMQREQIDAVIVTVKSYHTEETVRQLASLKGVPIVMSLQNGLGNERPLIKYFGKEHVFLGVCSHGATALSDTEVAWNGVGEIAIGSLDGSNEPYGEGLVQLFTQAGLHGRFSEEIEREVWRKVLVNCGINPLTALTRVTNGELLKSGELLSVIQQVVQEGTTIANRKGIDVGDAYARVLYVCQQTANNRSSMLQDVERGRPTEIDALNGALVRMGKEMGISLPVNQTLVALIHANSTVHV